MVKIVCLGDSITDCGRCFEPCGLGNGYVRFLADKLLESGAECEVMNQGVDGFTLARLTGNVKEYTDLRGDIITILIGINDIGLMMNTDRTLEQKEKMQVHFTELYDGLLTILSKCTDKLILMEPFVFPYPARLKSWIPYVRTMSESIQSLAAKYDAPYLLLHEELNAQARRYGLDALTTDGIHLTRQGQKFLADKLFDCISSHEYV